MIEITAFRWVPPFAQGHVRDLRARWALEEAGLPYRVRLVGRDEMRTPDGLALQPFGQVPALIDGDVTLFESGAIVLHVAEQARTLLPSDPAGRATALAWVFAALNSVEPRIQQLAELKFFPDASGTAAQRAPQVEAQVRARLADLAAALGQEEYLCGAFTAADILMTTVLRTLDDTGLVERHPMLAAYRDRCIARPAFAKALADQLADFAANVPAAAG